MMASQHGRALTTRLVAALHTEALLLADEVRAYFDETGRADRDRLAPMERVAFSCESLKVTTRLMHVIAWLLTRRAVAAGEIEEAEAGRPAYALGLASDSDAQTVALLPEPARALIEASRDLYARTARLERELLAAAAPPPPSPARALLGRLERAF